MKYLFLTNRQKKINLQNEFEEHLLMKAQLKPNQKAFFRKYLVVIKYPEVREGKLVYLCKIQHKYGFIPEAELHF